VTTSPDRITIRRAGLEDSVAVSGITDSAYSGYIPLIGRQPQPMTADYAHMVIENDIWVLELDGQHAGVLVLIHEPEALLIYSVAVHPDYQKQGLGRRLLAWAEQQAVLSGYRTIRLYTNARFTHNIHLYQRLGYQETGRETLLGSTVVHMAKGVGEEGSRDPG
jgi:ribosomal protein S18 acetylase RimI-like enzyme